MSSEQIWYAVDQTVDESRLYLPVVKTVGLALAITLIAIVLHVLIVEPLLFHHSLVATILYAVFIVPGFIYGLFFEYSHHRWLLHQKTLFLAKLFLEDHMYHHRLFRDENFQTRDPKRLDHVVTFWPTFPLAFICHYLAVAVVLRYIGLPGIIAMMFFVGVTIEFVYFEITHFAMHIEHSFVDRLFNTPKKRAHHELHHKKLSENFGVTTPVFDKIDGRLIDGADYLRSYKELLPEHKAILRKRWETFWKGFDSRYR